MMQPILFSWSFLTQFSIAGYCIYTVFPRERTEMWLGEALIQNLTFCLFQQWPFLLFASLINLEPSF